MKKNIVRGLMLVALSVTGFTSCLENVGNRFSLVNMMCTVVSSSSSQVVVQIDATQAYYFADELLGKNMEMGDRVLLEKMTVNNDEQPAGANGSHTAPIKMIEVIPQKINTDYVITEAQDEVKNDSVELFYSPYINRTKMPFGSTQTYITFSGATLKKANPTFRLVAKGILPDATEAGNDTICYEFKAINDKEGDKGVYESYAQCFRIQDMKSEQIVKVLFSGKRYQGAEANKINASYCVITAPKIYSEDN